MLSLFIVIVKITIPQSNQLYVILHQIPLLTTTNTTNDDEDGDPFYTGINA